MDPNALFAVDANFLGRLAEYLSTRPFREVAGFMQTLTNLKPISGSLRDPAHGQAEEVSATRPNQMSKGPA